LVLPRKRLKIGPLPFLTSRSYYGLELALCLVVKTQLSSIDVQGTPNSTDLTAQNNFTDPVSVADTPASVSRLPGCLKEAL
jgi:hypothetical protein